MVNPETILENRKLIDREIIRSILVKKLGDSWYERLKYEFDKDYMKDLIEFIRLRRSINVVYPPPGEVFNAYKWTPYEKVRICIIGQDPYIQDFQAHGIAFSTLNNSSPPSLQKIEEAIRRDVYQDDEKYIWYNNLFRWAAQGIMLLNKVLTVDKNSTGSHQGKGWEIFTAKTIRELDTKKGMIFLLWGKEAQTMKHNISNAVVIECEHPAAASYNKRDWDNKNCFNRVNMLLTERKINW